MTILAIDFEASCLPRHGRSFPIEVGVAVDDWSESWLIRPHESWRGWDWTAQAQALHGLTLERLYREGLPVETVFARLVAAVDGRRVVADSHIDQYWLETLSRAAGEPVPFAIDHVSRLLDEYGARDECIVAAVAQADARHPLRHRAASDAAWLSTLLGHVAPGSAVPMPPIMAMQRAASMSYGNNL